MDLLAEVEDVLMPGIVRWKMMCENAIAYQPVYPRLIEAGMRTGRAKPSRNAPVAEPVDELLKDWRTFRSSWVMF